MNRAHSTMHPRAPQRRGLMPLLLAAAGALAACAPGQEFIRHGNQLLEQGRVEEGLSELEKGLRAEPGNVEYRMVLIRQRETQIAALLAKADSARAAGRVSAPG